MVDLLRKPGSDSGSFWGTAGMDLLLLQRNEGGYMLKHQKLVEAERPGLGLKGEQDSSLWMKRLHSNLVRARMSPFSDLSLSLSLSQASSWFVIWVLSRAQISGQIMA